MINKLELRFSKRVGSDLEMAQTSEHGCNEYCLLFRLYGAMHVLQCLLCGVYYVVFSVVYTMLCAEYCVRYSVQCIVQCEQSDGSLMVLVDKMGTRQSTLCRTVWDFTIANSIVLVQANLLYSLVLYWTLQYCTLHISTILYTPVLCNTLWYCSEHFLTELYNFHSSTTQYT